MAVEQKSAAEAVDKKRELRLDRFVIWPVRLAQTVIELLRADPPPPQIAMLLGSCRNDSETATRACAHPAAASTIDDRRVDFVLGSVAVDRRARRSSDHRAAAALQRSPDQTVDERILKGCQRRLSGRGKRDEPVGVVPAGVGNRQQDRQVSTRLVDDWGGELAHGCWLNFVPD